MRTLIRKMANGNTLTAEVLIQAPRRGPGIPNHDGSKILFTNSTHKIGHGTLKELFTMDITTNQCTLLNNDETVHDANWIPGTNDVIYLKSGHDGTSMYFTTACDSPTSTLIAKFGAALSNLKLEPLQNGCVVFVVTGLVGADGSPYNEHTPQKGGTGRLYTTDSVRIVSSNSQFGFSLKSLIKT